MNISMFHLNKRMPGVNGEIEEKAEKEDIQKKTGGAGVLGTRFFPTMKGGEGSTKEVTTNIAI